MFGSKSVLLVQENFGGYMSFDEAPVRFAEVHLGGKFTMNKGDEEFYEKTERVRIMSGIVNCRLVRTRTRHFLRDGEIVWIRRLGENT